VVRGSWEERLSSYIDDVPLGQSTGLDSCAENGGKQKDCGEEELGHHVDGFWGASDGGR